jgi:intraflagellar transport protein 20
MFKKIEIMSFHQLIKSLNEVLDNHSKKIEKEKLKALGKRNQLYEEVESRDKREQELKVLIREKREELERLRFQNNSLLKVEEEQRIAIEKLSNNEDN